MISVGITGHPTDDREDPVVIIRDQTDPPIDHADISTHTESVKGESEINPYDQVKHQEVDTVSCPVSSPTTPVDTSDQPVSQSADQLENTSGPIGQTNETDPNIETINMSGEEEVSKKKAAPSKQKFGFKTLLKKLYKLSSSHIGLIIILLVYTFVGAGLFYWIEGENENKVIASIRQDRDRILGIIVNKSSDDEVDQSKHFDFVQSELRKYEEKLLDAMKHGITLDDENGPGSTEQRVWNIWGAMFYCATIYTTIGYGHIAPSTKEGKVVTMLYATIGIPLCLLVMTDLGKLFTRFIKFLWSFVYRFYRFGHCLAKGKTSSDDKKDEYVVKVDDEFNLHPLVAVFVVIVYIFMGSLMYKYWEDWSYLNAFYFIFITISTIGFGDVIPDHPKYFLATSIYILLGLALVAMVINVYIDFVSNTIDKATCRLSIVSRKIGLSLPNMDDDDEKKPPEGGLKQD